MDGRPLYEYARQGIPLPRPIEQREVIVHSLELVEWKGSDHHYHWPEKQFTDAEKRAMEKALAKVENNPTIIDGLEPAPPDKPPSAFVLSMKVSGGTYVRSIVHDLAHALGSAGHVVALTRSRQGRFVLEAEEESDRKCIDWDIFQQALEDVGGVDEEGWTQWEREVMNHLEAIHEKTG
jgi:tRNA pseudouridine55 synthase